MTFLPSDIMLSFLLLDPESKYVVSGGSDEIHEIFNTTERAS